MRLRLLVIAVIGACLLPASALASSRGPIQGKHRVDGHSTSTNWSGYDVVGSGAQSVTATWTQPAVADNCASGANSWSSPWVGIDGDTSGTVEQIGTDTDCVNGAPYFYAWYEMYPKGVVQITTVRVQPGDSFTGTVTTDGHGNYSLTLTNNSSHQTFGPFVQTNRHAHNASVEWIMEGPSGGLLTDFGTVSFTGASGVIGGQTVTQANATPITMVTKKGAARATPSLDPNGFTVTWNQS